MLRYHRLILIKKYQLKNGVFGILEKGGKAFEKRFYYYSKRINER